MSYIHMPLCTIIMSIASPHIHTKKILKCLCVCYFKITALHLNSYDGIYGTYLKKAIFEISTVF